MLISDQGAAEANLSSGMRSYLEALNKISEAKKTKVFVNGDELRGTYYVVVQPLFRANSAQYSLVVKKVLPDLQDAIRIKLNLLSSIMMTSPNHLQLNFTSGANISRQIALELASKDFT